MFLFSTSGKLTVGMVELKAIYLLYGLSFVILFEKCIYLLDFYAINNFVAYSSDRSTRP